MLRNKGVFDMPGNENLADDSFLPNMIHTRYGPGSSRTRYDAIAYYEPYLSLILSSNFIKNNTNKIFKKPINSLIKILF